MSGRQAARLPASSLPSSTEAGVKSQTTEGAPVRRQQRRNRRLAVGGADSGTLQLEAQGTQDKGSALARIRIIHRPSKFAGLDLPVQTYMHCTL